MGEQIMLCFKSSGMFNISGRGQVFTVINPIKTNEECWTEDYGFLIGLTVKIDDKKYKINGVERSAYAGIRRTNDPIGLLVKEAE